MADMNLEAIDLEAVDIDGAIREALRRSPEILA